MQSDHLVGLFASYVFSSIVLSSLLRYLGVIRRDLLFDVIIIASHQL